MRMLKRIALLALLWPAAVFSEPKLLDSKKLFSVRSSFNANEVVYEALLDGGAFDQTRPIRAYWILHTQDNKLEQLGTLEEKLAFGIVVEQLSRDEVTFHVKGAEKRPITVRIEPGKEGQSGVQLAAWLKLNGIESSLVSVYAAVDKRGLIPSVKYVELLGHGRADGKLITERITP
jgi:hypothetical protein